MEYLKAKASHLDNQEVSQIFQSLVLLAPQDPAFVKTLELLTLRRLHALHVDQLSQIIKAYSLLAVHGKIEQPSISFLQAFEAILDGKSNQYTSNIGGLAQALGAMIRLY